MMSRAQLAALAGGSALAVYAATRWLGGGGGALDDVGRVEIHDVLVARDSQMHPGRLEGCNASSCELDGRHFERRALAFIGLAVETSTPPAVEDPSLDELILRGGGVVHERLARIDDAAVFAGARRFEREEVAWIFLAPEREPPEPQAGAEAPSEPAPPEPPPPPPPPPPPGPDSESEHPPPVEPRPPRSPDDAFQGCPDDRPLGAWIWLRNDYVDVVQPDCIGVETHVVRFRLEPEPGTLLPGQSVALAYKAKELRLSVSTDGCFDAPQGDPNSTCNAEGTQVERTVPLTPENLGFGTFFPLIPSLKFQYPAPVFPPFQLTVRCLHHPTGVRSEGTANGFGGVSIDAGECADPQRECNAYCVAPTVCASPATAPQDCYQHPDRFAVVPFEGALVDGPEREERGLCTWPGSSQVRWRVCCGCAETGPPPEFNPRPPGDPCANGAAELAALVGRMRGLAEAYRTHEHSLRCAEAGREDARDRIWGLDGSLAQYFARLPWVATTGVRAPAGGRAEFLDNTRRIGMDLIEYAHAVRDGRMNVEGAVQWLIDMAGTTQAWRNAEDPMRGAYARALAEARRLAQQYLNRTGDVKGAAEIFDEDFAARAARVSPRQGLNALGALRNLSAWSEVWQASTRLVHDVSLYVDWKTEEDRARRDMESAQDAMRDLQAEIDALRARCPDLPPGSGVPLPDPLPNVCPDVPPGSEDLRTSDRPSGVVTAAWHPGATGRSGAASFGSFTLGASQRVELAAAESSGSAASDPEKQRLTEAHGRLDTAVQRIATRTAEAIAPRLVPFLLHETGDVEPAFLAALMEKAGAEIEALTPDLEEASAAAEAIQQIVEAARPPEAASPQSN